MLVRTGSHASGQFLAFLRRICSVQAVEGEPFDDEQGKEGAREFPHFPTKVTERLGLIGRWTLYLPRAFPVANAKNLGGVVWSIKQITSVSPSLASLPIASPRCQLAQNGPHCSCSILQADCSIEETTSLCIPGIARTGILGVASSGSCAAAPIPTEQTSLRRQTHTRPFQPLVSDYSPHDLTHSATRKMPTPQKRAQRGRRELRSDAIVESSSPSRPSKRRRKVRTRPAPLGRAPLTLRYALGLLLRLRAWKSTHTLFPPLTMFYSHRTTMRPPTLPRHLSLLTKATRRTLPTSLWWKMTTSLSRE